MLHRTTSFREERHREAKSPIVFGVMNKCLERADMQNMKDVIL